jgi:hypothetical protein
MSDYPTMAVMKTDIGSNAPGPPAPGGSGVLAAARNNLATARNRSTQQLEGDLSQLLAAAQPTRVLTDLAGDGTSSIPSLVAVWLISQVGQAVSNPKLVKLSSVKREELRSLGGVARLLHRTLHPVPAGAVSV